MFWSRSVDSWSWSRSPQPPVVAMVQMMESQCEYFMYFPAVPITDLSDPARYRSLPRRSHLYLGETVRFLLVLRCRDAAGTPSEQGPGKEEEGGPVRIRSGFLMVLEHFCLLVLM